MPLIINNRHVVISRDAAKIAACTQRYIAILCHRGELDGVHLPSGWLVFRDSLDRFVADRARRKAQLNRAIRVRRLAEYARGEILPA